MWEFECPYCNPEYGKNCSACGIMVGRGPRGSRKGFCECDRGPSGRGIMEPPCPNQHLHKRAYEESLKKK